MKLPPAATVPAPKREALIELFDRVKFHPLSIRVLAQQLKARSPAELGERLEQLLSSAGTSSEEATKKSEMADTPAGLLASLKPSLDKMDAAARKVLPRLGVFQGGAIESELVAITGLGDPFENERGQLQAKLDAAEKGRVRSEDDTEMPPESLERVKAKLCEDLVRIPLTPAANLWPALRQQLEAAALIEAEEIPGVTVPFLRFHPTLAPMLWAQLDAAERTRWSVAHRQRYYVLSSYLCTKDPRNPDQARAVAWRELPNLLHAVHATLDASEPDAVDFADNVNVFLAPIFGLKQEATRLAVKAQLAAGEVGSKGWFLVQSNRGAQLEEAGQVADASKIFQAILTELGETPSYKQALTLTRLGGCLRAGGRTDIAVERFGDAIAVLGKLA